MDFIAHLHARSMAIARGIAGEGGRDASSDDDETVARTLPSGRADSASPNERVRRPRNDVCATVKRVDTCAQRACSVNATDGGPAAPETQQQVAADHAAQVREMRDAFLRSR